MRAKEINVDPSGQEITQSIPGFPISCYQNVFTSDTYDIIDWHWHVELQLCLTTRGTVLWGTGSQRTPVGEGEGIFINSRRVHTARPLGGEAEFFCVDFSPDIICPDKDSGLYAEMVRPVLGEPGLDSAVIDRGTPEGAAVLAALEKISAVFGEADDGYEFVLAGTLLGAWRDLWAMLRGRVKGAPGAHGDRFRELLMFLQRNYAGPVSLDDAARCAGLSRSECCRYFKRQSGETISDYLRQYRLHKSMELLRGTELPVAQIAQSCGFSDQSYYTRLFRELTGMTPRQYRLRRRQP